MTANSSSATLIRIRTRQYTPSKTTTFVWSSQEEMDATLTRIHDLELGEGAVVFERAARLPNVDEETATEEWWSMKFESTLDPSPGANERGAILVSGQEISAQRNAQADLLKLHQQQEQFFKDRGIKNPAGKDLE